jgi:4-hydroxy-4-methyl-2-oxoglutarate aldolase
VHEITGELHDLVAGIPTPILADAVVRLGLDVRQAQAGIAGPPDAVVAGRALPVRHSGSVDVFLEALMDAAAGDVMVIDNAGRRDEACIGDLIVHEARHAGVVGFVIWGLHRDAVEIEALGMPVFSYGTVPFGPTELRTPPRDGLVSARFGEATVTRADVVAADRNGVVFRLYAVFRGVRLRSLAVGDVARRHRRSTAAGVAGSCAGCGSRGRRA